MILCAGTVAATGEQVQEKPGDSVIDLEYGEEINETCAACHGEFGEGSLDGEYPRLAGMPVAYLARQLRLFKQRERLNIPMMPYATERELPEEDVMAVSAYLASIELPTKLPPIDESADFNAYQRLIPQLAGQHSLYLLKQVNSIRNSERLHDEPDDAEVFQAYSDVEIGDLLAYLSVQDDD
jgi:cytochrome c553